MAKVGQQCAWDTLEAGLTVGGKADVTEKSLEKHKM